MTGNNVPPETENVSIDKIHITQKLTEPHHRRAIVSRMYEYAAKYNEQPFPKMNCQHAVVLNYKPEYKNNRLLFCVNTNNPNRPFVQMFFNPSCLLPEDLDIVVNNIRFILGDRLFYKLFSEGNVSQLDIAFDIKNITFDDLVFNRNRQRSGGGHFSHDKDGRIGTYYIGSESSDLRYRIYNKTKQLFDKKGIDAPYPITRIEAEIKINQPLRMIANIKNPFERFDVFKLSDMIADKRLPICVADSIHFRGLPAVLQLLGDNERKAMEQLLTDYKVEIPPADEVFGLWKQECASFLKLFRPPVRSFSKLNPRKDVTEDKEFFYYLHAEQRSCRIDGERQTYVEPYTDSKAAA